MLNEFLVAFFNTSTTSAGPSSDMYMTSAGRILVISSTRRSKPVPRIQPGVLIIRGQVRSDLWYVSYRSVAQETRRSGAEAGVTDAKEWHLRIVFDGSSKAVWVNGTPKFGFETHTSDTVPGGANSGCPGSRSSNATRFTGFPAFEDVRRRFVSNLEKVDLPADFGPQTKVVRWPVPEIDSKDANFLFHSGGETNS